MVERDGGLVYVGGQGEVLEALRLKQEAAWCWGCSRFGVAGK